jgi:XTP/dITP diphosphohydrolase
MKLVLATRNRGKVREIGEILKVQDEIELLSLLNYPDAPAVVEDGKTYEENAIKKASVLAEYTGYLTIADDSGLEVDALDGAPGLHSARYAGENASDADRIAKLLDALRDVPDDQRMACFKCAVAIAKPDSQTQVEPQSEIECNPDLQSGCEQLREIPILKVIVGVCEGRIIRAARGVQGFGYDPVFVPSDYDETFAELGEEIKNQISHRAKALVMVRELVNEYGDADG